MDDWKATLEELLKSLNEMGNILEAELAQLTAHQRARSPFAYLMEPAVPSE